MSGVIRQYDYNEDVSAEVTVSKSGESVLVSLETFSNNIIETFSDITLNSMEVDNLIKLLKESQGRYLC